MGKQSGGCSECRFTFSLWNALSHVGCLSYRKSSLKKGLNSLSGNTSGFERFNDEQHDVELSPSPSKT